MQRTQRILVGGLILTLLMNWAATVPAEVWYVPSSSWQTVPVSQPVVVGQTYNAPVYSTPVYSAQAYVLPSYSTYTVSSPVVYSEPVYVPQSVYYEPVAVSRSVVVSQPVQVYQPLVSSPWVTREKVKSRPGHYEYEQKGKFQAFDGRRMKTYRYEYEVDQRPWRTKVKYDIDD